MLKYIYILVGFYLPAHCFCQTNLVQNGNFESSTKDSEVIDRLICTGWKCIDCGEINYIVSDSNSYSLEVNPFDGKAFVGLNLYVNGNTCPQCMEHIQTKLAQPLVKGKTYKVTLWAAYGYKLSQYCTFNIGGYLSAKDDIFSGQKAGFYQYLYLQNSGVTPQIRNNPDSCICDSNWHCITDEYVAAGGEQFLTVGFFWLENAKIIKQVEVAKNRPTIKNIKRLSTLINREAFLKNPRSMHNKRTKSSIDNSLLRSYYFIDNVSIIEVK